MATPNSWEDDPSAQDDNLSQRAQQQLNMNPAPAQGGFQPNINTFQPGAASFTPGAASFQPGQAAYGGYQPQFQQQQFYQQPYYQQQFNAQQGYGGQFNQPYGGFNQGYGMTFAHKKTLLSIKLR
jgi:peptide chain release factor subunit 3